MIKTKRSPGTDHAEELAAEIVAAFAVTKLRPVTGGFVGFGHDKCGCAARVLVCADGNAGRRSPGEHIPRRSVVPARHLSCLYRGWDWTRRDDRDDNYCDDESLCAYFLAGSLAATAMETP